MDLRYQADANSVQRIRNLASGDCAGLAQTMLDVLRQGSKPLTATTIAGGCAAKFATSCK